MAVAESPSTSPKTCEERDSRLSPGSIKLYGKKPANWGLLSVVSWDEARFTGLFLVWIFTFYLGHWSVCFNNLLHQLAWRCSLLAIHSNANLVGQTPASAAHSKHNMFPSCVTILMTSLHLKFCESTTEPISDYVPRLWRELKKQRKNSRAWCYCWVKLTDSSLSQKSLQAHFNTKFLESW
jgi:hypothetical protein